MLFPIPNRIDNPKQSALALATAAEMAPDAILLLRSPVRGCWRVVQNPSKSAQIAGEA
jgi:hypothetical protein